MRNNIGNIYRNKSYGKKLVLCSKILWMDFFSQARFSCHNLQGCKFPTRWRYGGVKLGQLVQKMIYRIYDSTKQRIS